GGLGFGLNFFFLNVAHHVNDALENMVQLSVRQRSATYRAHILKNLLLAVRLVDGHLSITLEAANLFGSLRALIEQLNHFAVELIDFLAPLGDIHALTRS